MTTVVSLKKMRLTQKLKRVKNGLTMTCGPWLKEEKIILPSLCGQLEMKSVKLTEMLIR